MSSKVKDGLFLGDIDAAQDAEFLQLNGIVHIVNCVPRQVPNLFQQSLGLSYVTCDLEEVLRRPFFDLKNRQFMGIVQLIDRALERTESVLVHSLNGVNRSPSVLMGYLMVKYCWGVDKAYEYLLTKRTDIKPHESYIDQLCLLEAQLQGLFGSRANEQQLYEWVPSLADPLTDEIVLVHTYLNTPSTAKQFSKKDQPKPPSTRRLSWIDQVPQMKKLYPSLMIKPERPPNHSYNDMLPSNGWTDLLVPSHQTTTGSSGGTAPRPIAAFLDPPTSDNVVTSCSGNDPDADDDASAVSRGHRVHSFSVPKRREIEIEGTLSPSSTSSDRDEQDLTIDDVGPTPLPTHSKAVPRYQQQIRGSVTTTRLSRQPHQQQTRSVGSRGSVTSSTSMTSSAVRLSGGGGVTSTTMASSTGKPSTTKSLDHVKPIKPGSRVTSAKSPSSSVMKQPMERRTSTNSGGSFSARGSFSGDLPLPQTVSAFSVRRSIIDTDPWAVGGASTTFPTATPSATARPRTAPPRLRKKDSDSGLFGSKASAAPASNTSGANRVNIDVWSLPASGSSRRLSTAPGDSGGGAGPSLRPQKLSGRNFLSASAAASRPKASRAQWK